MQDKFARNVNSVSFQFTVKYSALTWVCILYALLIISVGLCLPVIMGWDMTGTQNALDRYLEFYIFLYSIGICYFIFYHITARTVVTCWRFTFSSMNRFCVKMWNILATPSSVTEVELDEMKNNKLALEADEEVEKQTENLKPSSGHFGLKCGVKASVVVLGIMIVMELSTFAQARFNGMACHLDAKGIYAVVQLIYVVFQTFFVLKPDQKVIELYPVINHIGVAHLIGTTICTGFLLTAYDCLLQLHSLQQNILFTNKSLSNDKGDIEINQDLPDWLEQNIKLWNLREAPNNETLTDASPCSLKSYLNSTQSQMKPFTHTFTMFYVYCCSILLFLLCFHIRQKLHESSRRMSTSAFFKKLTNPKTATFSSGAGVSLIVLSIIISILTMNANDNVYAEIFLFFIHAQASAVGLIALGRIADVPCRHKLHPSKYATIYLIFFFFVCLSGVLEIIGKCKELSDETANYTIALEIATGLLDLFQAFLHGLLILIGFTVEASATAIRDGKMPKHILIHLAASNFAALLSGVFNSKTVLFENIQKILRLNAEDTTARMFWSILASILNPCEEFNRFTTIIYLIKLFKTWYANNDIGVGNGRNIRGVTVVTIVAL